MQAHLSFKDASTHVKTGTNGEPQSREGGSFGKGTEGIQLGGSGIRMILFRKLGVGIHACLLYCSLFFCVPEIFQGAKKKCCYVHTVCPLFLTKPCGSEVLFSAPGPSNPLCNFGHGARVSRHLEEIRTWQILSSFYMCVDRLGMITAALRSGYDFSPHFTDAAAEAQRERERLAEATQLPSDGAVRRDLMTQSCSAREAQSMGAGKGRPWHHHTLGFQPYLFPLRGLRRAPLFVPPFLHLQNGAGYSDSLVRLLS